MSEWGEIYKSIGAQPVINAIGTTFLTNNVEQIITAFVGGAFSLAFAVCILYFLTRPNVIEALKN